MGVGGPKPVLLETPVPLARREMGIRLALALWACSSVAHAFFLPAAPGIVGAKTANRRPTAARALLSLPSSRRTVRHASALRASMELQYDRPTVVDAKEEQSATMIWLHGLGDTGSQWQRLSESVAVPWVKFVCPTAPRAPSTLSGGSVMHQWYDIEGLEVKVCNPLTSHPIPTAVLPCKQAPSRSRGSSGRWWAPWQCGGVAALTTVAMQELRSDAEGMQKSIDYIHKLIDEEVANGTPEERIVIGGFSQGGCVALAAALTYKKQLGGCVAVSSWYHSRRKSRAVRSQGVRQYCSRSTRLCGKACWPGCRYPRGVADEPSEANKQLPVLLCHGDRDPIAKVEWSTKSFDYLQQLGLPTLGNIYPEIGHEFSPSEVLDMREFLQKNVPPMYKAKVDKPLGATMTEAAFPKGGVQVGGLKEESNAMKAGVQVGDQLLRLNDKPLKTAGFDAVMDEIIAAEGSLELQFVRPIPDREVDWGVLSEEEQDRRARNSRGVIKVCSDGPCNRQGAKNVIRWVTDLTPPEFSVSRCGCTGNCGNGPNVVVAGKGKEERVLYGVNSVGTTVKMLREEYEIETDPDVVNAILNPQKNAEFAISDELVRRGILASITIRGSFDTNRF